MKDFVIENASKSRRAVAIGCLVLFSVRRRSRDGYRSPVQWLKLKYASNAMAIEAAIGYAAKNRILGMRRRVRLLH